MNQKIAVLFMPDNIACTEEKTPLMLQPILFCPVLTWMCAELCGRGIERLFIVSDVSAQERMKPYLPKEADVTFVDGAKHAEELLKLLEGETGSVLIVNGVVLPVGVFSAGAEYTAPPENTPTGSTTPLTIRTLPVSPSRSFKSSSACFAPSTKVTSASLGR